MKNYRWKILENNPKDVIKTLLENRGLTTKQSQKEFLNPPAPFSYTPKEVGIKTSDLSKALKRIKAAIKNKEKIIVYGDYDADGISATAIIWETLNSLGADVLPYIPKRLEEGYGLSKKGLDNIVTDKKPSLIITVDHGITAEEEVAYAKSLGIEVIILDHHVKPKKLPRAFVIIHTISLCASGIAFLVANLLKKSSPKTKFPSHLDLAAIGTIGDMSPLINQNRSIAKYGLEEINRSTRLGLNEVIKEAGLTKGEIGTYEVSFIIAPRLNAMGRLEHALESLRLLCARNPEKARELALHLGQTNRTRQQLTLDTTTYAKKTVQVVKKLIFISHETYEQGVIGLVAGKLVEEFYRPAIVVSKGEKYSKASARSINGFNIIEAIRSFESMLISAGGHPMAAGFTIETEKLEFFKKQLEEYTQEKLTDNLLERTLKIDAEINLEDITWDLFEKIKKFEPFGIGNPEPTFATKNCRVTDLKTVGTEGKHLKLGLAQGNTIFTAIAFGMGILSDKLKPGQNIDVAYSLSANLWNGNKSLELKVKDIKI